MTLVVGGDQLYELSDVIPDAVHISVPRVKRSQSSRSGVRIHTLSRPPGSSEKRILHGIPVTTPERSIVDSLEAGTQLEQIELAVRQALARGLTTPRLLLTAAENRSLRVRRFIEQQLSGLD